MHHHPLPVQIARAAGLFAAGLGTLFAMTLGLVPMAHAAVNGGDLVKLPDDGNLETNSDSAVYYVGADGKRYAFPSSQAYFTWYASFDGVKVISPTEMASLQLGGNITYRPGTRLVKITSDPNVYAVEPDGLLRHITSEAIAKELYGDAWNKRVDDIPDAFFFNYRIGAPLVAATFPSGTVVKRTSDGAYFRIADGVKRKIASAEARTALRVQESFVVQTGSTLDSYSSGEDIVGAEATIADTSQKSTEELPSMTTLLVRVPASTYFVVGGDAALIDLKISSRQAVVLKRIAVRVDAGTGINADEDNDRGGLIHENNARKNFTRFRFHDAAGIEPFTAQDPILDPAKDNSQTFVFEGSYLVPANSQQVLSFLGHSDSLLPSGETYKVTVLHADLQIVDVGTGAAVTFAPETDLVGPMMTALNESVELSAGTAFSAHTYVRGSKNVDLASITVKATTVAPNVITSLTVQGYVDEEANGTMLAGVDADNGSETLVRDMITSLSLYDTLGTRLAGPVTVDVSGRATFSAMNFVIPAGSSANVVIKGDLNAALDVEEKGNRVTFDVVHPGGDVTATDEKGVPVSVTGENPNGGSKATVFATIVKNGTLSLSWTGTSGASLASTEVLLGTFTSAATGDDYALKALTFKLEGEGKSLDVVRLEYDGGSRTGLFTGGLLTFSNLPFTVSQSAPLAFKLYGKLRSRENGAVTGEVIKVSMVKDGVLQFDSLNLGDHYDETALVGGDFTLASTASANVVRLTILSIKADSLEGANGYRDASAPVLGFTMQAANTADARIRKLTFLLTPGDAGNEETPLVQSLSGWAKINGDFADDNDVVNLRMTTSSGNKSIIGEDTSTRLSYSIVHGGARISNSSTVVPEKGDTAVIEYSFAKGSELVVAAGALLHFSFEIDTNVFAPKDYGLGVSLAGGDDFMWSDVGDLSAAQLNGNDATTLPVSNSLVVKY